MSHAIAFSQVALLFFSKMVITTGNLFLLHFFRGVFKKEFNKPQPFSLFLGIRILFRSLLPPAEAFRRYFVRSMIVQFFLLYMRFLRPFLLPLSGARRKSIYFPPFLFFVKLYPLTLSTFSNGRHRSKLETSLPKYSHSLLFFYPLFFTIKGFQAGKTHCFFFTKKCMGLSLSLRKNTWSSLFFPKLLAERFLCSVLLKLVSPQPGDPLMSF